MEENWNSCSLDIIGKAVFNYDFKSVEKVPFLPLSLPLLHTPTLTLTHSHTLSHTQTLSLSLSNTHTLSLALSLARFLSRSLSLSSSLSLPRSLALSPSRRPSSTVASSPSRRSTPFPLSSEHGQNVSMTVLRVPKHRRPRWFRSCKTVMARFVMRSSLLQDESCFENET